MMVRFSDIVKGRGRIKEEKKQQEPESREDGFRLSDSPFFNTSNPDTPLKRKVITRRGSSFEAGSYYRALVDRAREISQMVKHEAPPAPAPVLAVLHSIVDRGLVETLYEYAMSEKDSEGDITVHTVDVTLVSLKLGLAMNYDTKTILRLGLAAFLENVGMYEIPESILLKKDVLSAEETDVIKRHPEKSHDILLKLGDRYKWLAETALKTHERIDGSGYPNGLKRDEISELSSIVGLSDVYCAMIRNRPYRRKHIQTDAVKIIVECGRGKFPAGIIKLFLNEISLFPINSYVKLSNGSVGRVISINKQHALNPDVEVVYDHEGNRLGKKQEISLAGNPLLYIDRCIDPVDLKG